LADAFCDGLALVAQRDPKNLERDYYYIDKSGNAVITDLPYDKMFSFHNGLAEVQVYYDVFEQNTTFKYYKCGYIDKTGKLVLPIEYDMAYPLSDGLFVVGKGNEVGIIDVNGNVIVPFRYARRGTSYLMGYASIFYDFSALYALRYGVISINDEWFDTSGNPAQKPMDIVIQEEIGKKLNGDKPKTSVSNGVLVGTPDYIDVIDYGFQDGVARVEKSHGDSHSCGLIDQNYKYVVPFGVYFSIGQFYNGIASAEKFDSHEKGFIDTFGNIVVPFGYYKYIDGPGIGMGDGLAIALRGDYCYILQIGDATTDSDIPPIPEQEQPPPETGISVVLNGNALSFDVPPQLINDRTMVPLRAIFEAMGASVEWDNNTQTVTATKDGIVVVLTSGSTLPTINGSIITIDQSAIIIEGRTLAPLRFVAEAFGGKVDWDGSTKTAYITK